MDCLLRRSLIVWRWEYCSAVMASEAYAPTRGKNIPARIR